ncbi:uncharacterized protein PHALS_04621 [Plasmopara halstedii]|uniref:Uncharacterized protein n=1 Tax=Plasmopara halstedii TaxID=4781 RepID=A0A0P1AAB9_PLAHL|nr:uncharacterized protein PHALS_04621 [Plasmopara halstedii]CEG37173.1 hypothetical protein PHALS_04621 [Plasmopara halstedii]|eukprot:XP_024573542.1 hypothetical protein PHALS_04621 [Plasmopara halstedii]
MVLFCPRSFAFAREILLPAASCCLPTQIIFCDLVVAALAPLTNNFALLFATASSAC